MKNPNNLWTKYVNVFRQAISNRQILNADQYRPEESQFLSSSLSIQETPLSPLPRINLWAISLLTIFAVLWSIFGEINVIVSGSGSVKDMKIGTQNIQALDTVVVKKILVHEGDIVKKGQTLIELDINIPKAELDKNMQDVSNMYHEKIKKQIIIDSINNNLSEDQINNKIKNSVLKNTDEIQQIKLSINEFRSKEDKFNSEIENKKIEINTLSKTIDKQKNTLDDLKQRILDYKILYDENNISRHIYEDKLTLAREQEMDLEVSKSKILEIKSLIKNIIASRESFINEYKNSLFSYLNEMEGKIQLIKYEIDKNNTRIELLNIVAPVDGKVQQISVNTIGAIIPSSTVIMQIVPIQNSFSIEALLTNKDISQLSNNNPAIFKVDAFPYSKFGTIDCKIQNISNDSIDLKDSKEKFYKINLEIINNLEQLSEKGIYLKAGMTGSTSFKVGERKIIEYLLSPLTEYKNEVMREP